MTSLPSQQPQGEATDATLFIRHRVTILDHSLMVGLTKGATLKTGGTLLGEVAIYLRAKILCLTCGYPLNHP